MLTLYEFNGLSDKAQGVKVFTEGIFIDDRKESDLNVQLYRLNDFYVEVYYDAGANKIMRLRSFSSPAQLAPYVQL